jgi:uncharacterized membrane protein YfcA
MTASTSHDDAPASTRNRTILIVLVGICAGFLSGLFGVGGGILVVPGLVLVAKMDQRLAHGTSLAAVLPISAASMVTYWAHDNIDWPVALFLAIGAVAGAVLGTRLLAVLPYRTLGIAFSVVLILSAIRLFIPTDGDGRADLTVLTAIGLVIIGLATGILAGLLGVGGGIIMVPAMIVLFGILPVIAKGTSLAVIIPTAIMGTWRNRKKKNADLRAAAILGLSGILTAFAGAWVSDRMSDDLSNILFATLLVIVAVRLLRQLERERKAGQVAEHDPMEETIG